jgi:hypothetical protein
MDAHFVYTCSASNPSRRAREAALASLPPVRRRPRHHLEGIEGRLPRMSDSKNDEALVAMQEGRFRDAAILYERAAMAAYQAADMPAMIGPALMAVNGYAYAADGAQALRVASAAVDALKDGPHKSEIRDFAAKVLRTLRKQELGAAMAAFSAHVDQATAPPAPLPKFCSGCGKPVNAQEVVHPTPSASLCRHCGHSLQTKKAAGA